MLSLLLSIVCSVLIGNLLLIFLQKQDARILSVFLGNYIIAALFSFCLANYQKRGYHSFDIWFGIISGCLFLANFLIYQANIRTNGLSLSVGTMRVSVIIPAVCAVLIFADHFSPLIAIGIIIVISAFAYNTNAKSKQKTAWLLSLFLVTGITELTLKIYSEFGSQQQASFFVVLFSSAGVATLALLAFQKQTIDWKSLLLGFGLGIPNQLSSLFFLKALDSVPATLAYPFTASGIVILSIGCDFWIWKKRFNTRQRWSLALLTLGVVILGLAQ
jgi:drug/metabolite transporter (DMT)-like permease